MMPIAFKTCGYRLCRGSGERCTGDGRYLAKAGATPPAYARDSASSLPVLRPTASTGTPSLSMMATSRLAIGVSFA